MKHSIKREQSHARMSFAECENQRSLAEGESNVRATLKHMKLSFNLILILALWLVAAQGVGAAKVMKEKTVTWIMDGGASGSTTVSSNSLELFTTYEGANQTLRYTSTDPTTPMIFLSNSDKKVTFWTSTTKYVTGNCEIVFPDIEGKVTKVELNQGRFFGDGKQKMIVGTDKSTPYSNSKLLHLKDNTSDYDYESVYADELYINFIYEGSIDVSASSPLKLMFVGEDTYDAVLDFKNGSIIVTYETEEEVAEDPGHTFSFEVSGDKLIAECNSTNTNHTCGLTDRKATLTLTADDTPYNALRHRGSLNLAEFITQTGLQVSSGGFSYIDKSTQQVLSDAPIDLGTYTVTATVIINSDNEHPYVLTKDFGIYNGTITCNYPQFSFSPKPAIADKDVTITFTPIAGEGVETLTVTGENTNMSIGNGITDHHNGTYTFTMVKEPLTIDATFSVPDASHFEQTGTDEYTIKTANGWGWFCFATNYDLAPEGFSGKTVKLATSVSSSEMAGTSGHPFKGMFDGDGHTLTFNLQASEGYSAPFHYTDGATISNLHVTGLIEGNDISPLAGLVGKATGNLTINNCHVSTQISTTHSGAGFHGGIIAFWDDSNVACTITGCVYDGLIYNPSEANVTSYCSGFIGNFWGRNNTTVTFTDCLYAPVAYGTGKYALGGNCFTFVYPNSDPNYNMTNCYYTSILGNRQGRPAATATDKPDNIGKATDDHGMVDGYENGFLYDGNYYTPKYGDAVVEYRFNDWNERADVTINGTNNQSTGVNVVGVNITEEVGNIKSVTYNRPFNTTQAATVILPFSYICNGSEGGKFFGFKEVVYNEGMHKWVCTMQEPSTGSLTANTPYLFMPSETTMTFPNMAGGVVTLQPTTANDGVYGGATTDAAWNFHGTYKGKSWAVASNDYGFAAQSGIEAGGEATVEAGQFVRFTTGAFIKPMRCYLSYVGTSAPARRMTRSAAATDDLPQSITVRLVSRNGETTAIGTLDTSTGEVSFDSEAWYTLDGVRLSSKPSTKGIYINNGKKVAIK